MRKIAKTLAIITPALALASAGSAGEPPRALALNVTQSDGSVELELVAQSHVAQHVSYELELKGPSRSRSSGSTELQAGERHVLSRMKSNVGDDWCAVLDVTESSGATYRVTAGSCE